MTQNFLAVALLAIGAMLLAGCGDTAVGQDLEQNLREDADMFTSQIFDRLEGLKSGGPIHANYNPFDGRPLMASHFSCPRCTC